MRHLWSEASSKYFDPPQFQLALQQCIAISRTVTFILQAQKDHLPGFDEWYAPHQAAIADDAIMKWAKEARNFIEKRGDLETRSQVRGRIIASYIGGPESNWVPQSLFASPHEVLAAVPKKFLVPHVLENGTLVIERRWVDSALPDIEVLEALAHVYSRLAEIVVSFLSHLQVAVPPVVADVRPETMATLAMDRAIYLSIKDGSERGFRYFKKKVELPNEPGQRQLIARYGKAATWKHLEGVNSFRGVAEAYFKTARAMMLRDGRHVTLTFFLKGNNVTRVIMTNFPDRASKYVIMRDLAQLATVDSANGVMVIGEAWIAVTPNIPKSGFASDAKNRGECILLDAVNADGESIFLSATVHRKKIKKWKIRSLGPTRIEEIDVNRKANLYPFLEEWGRLDHNKINEFHEELQTMGIEVPAVQDTGSRDP